MKRLMLLMIAVGFTSCAYDGYQVGVQTQYYTPRPTYQYYAPRPTYRYCAPAPRYSPTWGSVDRWHYHYHGTIR
jgi:hypothetical protein